MAHLHTCIGIIVEVNQVEDSFTSWVPSRSQLLRAGLSVLGGDDLEIGNWILASEDKNGNLRSVRKVDDIYETCVVEEKGIFVVCPVRVPPGQQIEVHGRHVYNPEVGWAVGKGDEMEETLTCFEDSWITAVLVCVLTRRRYEKLMRTTGTIWRLHEIQPGLSDVFSNRVKCFDKMPWEKNEKESRKHAEKAEVFKFNKDKAQSFLDYVLSEIDKNQSYCSTPEQKDESSDGTKDDWKDKTNLQVAYESGFDDFLAQQVSQLKSDLMSEGRKSSSTGSFDGRNQNSEGSLIKNKSEESLLEDFTESDIGPEEICSKLETTDHKENIIDGSEVDFKEEIPNEAAKTVAREQESVEETDPVDDILVYEETEVNAEDEKKQTDDPKKDLEHGEHAVNEAGEDANAKAGVQLVDDISDQQDVEGDKKQVDQSGKDMECAQGNAIEAGDGADSPMEFQPANSTTEADIDSCKVVLADSALLLESLIVRVSNSLEPTSASTSLESTLGDHKEEQKMSEEEHKEENEAKMSGIDGQRLQGAREDASTSEDSKEPAKESQKIGAEDTLQRKSFSLPDGSLIELCQKLKGMVQEAMGFLEHLTESTSK